VNPEVRFYRGDVNDQAVLGQIIRKHELEACIYFAASAYVEESVQDPGLYVENNVLKGVGLIGVLLGACVHRFALRHVR
jgi:UDP-glucose 4-epimerase